MLEREWTSSGKMTFSYLWHYILYYLCLSLIVGFIYTLVVGKINFIVLSIITIVTFFITIFLSARLATSDIFKKKKLEDNAISKFFRNIVIFFIICMVLTILYNAINYQTTVVTLDKKLEVIEEGENKEKLQSIVDEVKSMQKTVTIVVCIIECSMYLVMIPIQRKMIDKSNMLIT